MPSLPIGCRRLGLAIALATSLIALGSDDPPRSSSTLKLADCPAAVRKTIELEAKGATIGEVEKAVTDEKPVYSTSFVSGGKHYRMNVDEKGTLEELALEITGDDEVEFSMCPAAVQSTFRHEAPKGMTFDTVMKDLKYGTVIYEVVVPVGNKEYSLVVADNGTLVEKMLIFAEDEIELSHCPSAVQHAIKEHARGGKVAAITRSTAISGHVYEAEIEVDGKEYLLELTEGGGLISKSLLDDQIP